jgi:hypothetical protein
MRWTEDQYNDFLRMRDAGNKNSAAGAASNMEQAPSHEPVGEKKIPRLDSPCRIHVHSRRHRLADPDGISGKAAIDGLVHSGILPDDSTRYVQEVTYSQSKVKTVDQEETEVIISW